MLEAQDALINLRHSPAQSVDVEVNANVAPNVDVPRVDSVLGDEDDCDFDGAVEFDKVEYAGVKRLFRDL